jgi:hypothetical protein
MGKQWDDEGGRGRRNDKHGGGGNFRGGAPTGGGEYQRRAPRGPLDWVPTHTLAHGEAQAVISTATGDQGDRLYSYTIGRTPRGDKPGSKFLVPHISADAKALIDDVMAWIEADKAGRGSDAA